MLCSNSSLNPFWKKPVNGVDQHLLIAPWISGAGMCLHFVLDGVFFNNVKS